MTSYVKGVATLHCEILVFFRKLHPPKAQQRQTKRMCNEENLTAVDELIFSQQSQPQIYRLTHKIA